MNENTNKERGIDTYTELVKKDVWDLQEYSIEDIGCKIHEDPTESMYEKFNNSGTNGKRLGALSFLWIVRY